LQNLFIYFFIQSINQINQIIQSIKSSNQIKIIININNRKFNKMLSRKFVSKNKVFFAIFLFLAIFAGFHTWKPSFAYAESGAFRPFGIGYRHKTVIPIWLIAILLAILSYLAILVLIRNL